MVNELLTKLKSNFFFLCETHKNYSRDKEKLRIEEFLEKALDLMINSDSLEPPEGVVWMQTALQNLLYFAENPSNDVLVEEVEKQEKVITAADVGTLIKNLSLCSKGLNS
jgi:hypothetical protein